MLYPQTHGQMLTRIAAMKSDFEPGSKGQYSNTNFVLLSYIIEKITNRTYAEVVNKRIISKIGLKDTYYGVKTNTANNEALSYSYNGKWKRFFETDMSIPTGAGSMVSTPVDLDRFIEALFAGKLVKTTSLELMKTMKDKFGFAMFLSDFKGRASYGHGGAIDAFLSELAYFPAEKLAVSYVSDGGGYSPEKVMQAVFNIYFNQPYAIPVFTEVSGPDKYLGVYTSKQMPLKITIGKEGSTLTAQATGQSSFQLDATPIANNFEFDAAGIVIEFRPEKGEFTLKQGGGEYIFNKEQK
jgi:D-alanyl-D-alanine carboxypeptidase